MSQENKMKVFYNSACPVCDAGINLQKNKSSHCEIDWHDIHTNHEAVKQVNSELEFVRERLHVIDENDQIKVGIDAFIAIWLQSPKEKWKAKILTLPVVKPIANAAYNGFAFVLYKWNRRRGSW